MLLLVLRGWVVLCFVLLIVTSVVSLIYSKNSFTLSKRERLVIVFFVAAFLSPLLTYILGDFTVEETTNLVHNLAFLGFVPVFLLVKRNGLPKQAFWYGIVIGAMITGISALVEVTVLNHSRATGGHHHIIYGDHALLLAMLSLLAFSFFKEKGKFYLLLPILGLFLGLMASVLSTARGSWIVFPVFLLIVAIFFRQLGSIRTRLTYLLAFVFLAIFAYAIPQTEIKDRIDQAISDIHNYQTGIKKSTSVGLRFEMWRASKELVVENPITGIGLHQYPHKIKELVDSSNTYEKAIGRFAHPHNEYLYALVERGVIGLFTILPILLYPMYLFFRSLHGNNRPDRSIAIAGLLITTGYAIFGLTESIFNRPTTINYYTMMMALLLGSLYSRSAGSAERA